MENSKRRVVVTGIGIISSCGFNVDEFWSSMVEGKSGISKIENMPLEGHTVHIAGEIKDFENLGLIDPKTAKRFDRFIQFGVAAANEAVNDAGITTDTVDPYRYGVVFASGIGGFDTIEKQHNAMIEKGFTRCSPFTIPMLIPNMAAGKISIDHGAKGLNKCVVSACASSNHAIGDAFRAIQYGDADVIITGGSEATITNLGLGAFTSLRALSKRNDEPEKASRPFDKDRDGFIMSEGGAALILEELEHAKARGAKIYAEIVGYGQSADGYDIVAPDPNGFGAVKSMELAIKDAGITPQDVDYVNAHGTSTGLGDIAESNAVKKVFGDIEANKKLKVSSTKSIHGHLLGATGAVESVVCVKTILTGIVPPTINLENQDEEVANLNYVPNKAQKADVKYALTNSFGFGGHNATLVFKKFEN